MIRPPVRLPAALLTLVLFLATGIGVPVHHHADHHGEATHLTTGDHGHGATLLVRDMRTERPSPAPELPAVSRLAALPSPPAASGKRHRRPAAVPTGRSPPPALRPRAPPSSS